MAEWGTFVWGEAEWGAEPAVVSGASYMIAIPGTDPWYVNGLLTITSTDDPLVWRVWAETGVVPFGGDVAFVITLGDGTIIPLWYPLAASDRVGSSQLLHGAFGATATAYMALGMIRGADDQPVPSSDQTQPPGIVTPPVVAVTGIGGTGSGTGLVDGNGIPIGTVNGVFGTNVGFGGIPALNRASCIHVFDEAAREILGVISGNMSKSLQGDWLEKCSVTITQDLDLARFMAGSDVDPPVLGDEVRLFQEVFSPAGSFQAPLGRFVNAGSTGQDYTPDTRQITQRYEGWLEPGMRTSFSSNLTVTPIRQFLSRKKDATIGTVLRLVLQQVAKGGLQEGAGFSDATPPDITQPDFPDLAVDAAGKDYTYKDIFEWARKYMTFYVTYTAEGNIRLGGAMGGGWGSGVGCEVTGSIQVPVESIKANGKRVQYGSVSIYRLPDIFKRKPGDQKLPELPVLMAHVDLAEMGYPFGSERAHPPMIYNHFDYSSMTISPQQWGRDLLRGFGTDGYTITVTMDSSFPFGECGGRVGVAFEDLSGIFKLISINKPFDEAPQTWVLGWIESGINS